MYLADTIFSLNLIVLFTVYYWHLKGAEIAIESVRAMSLRTIVWFFLFVGAKWLSRMSKLYGSGP
jgi:hypothetical protein